MKTSFYATVVDGTLQLDELVPLANNSRVQVNVIPLEENRRRWQQALSALRDLKATRPIVTGLPRPQREELYDRP